MSKATTELSGLADELGSLRAQKKTLETREKEIRDELIEAGIEVLEDDTFLAKRVESMRELIDWKAVAEKLEPSHQLVTAHTTQKEIISIRTSIRPEAVA